MGNKVRLTVTLPTAVIAFTVVLTLSVIGLNFYTTSKALETLAFDELRNIRKQVLSQLISYFAPSSSVVKHNAFLAGNDVNKMAIEHGVHKSFINQLEVFPQLALIYYGDESGNFISAEHVNAESKFQVREIKRQSNALQSKLLHFQSPNELVSTSNDDSYQYDPRQRPWYKMAKAQQQLICTKAYRFKASGKLGITLAYPVVVDGKFKGVAGVDVYLDTIAKIISEVKIAKNGLGFIVNRKGEAVVLPQNVKADRDAGQALTNLGKVDHAGIKLSYAYLLNALKLNADQPLSLEDEKVFKFPVEKEPYYGVYTVIPNGLGLDWIIGVIVPEDDFLGEVKQSVMITLFTSFWVLALGILFCVLFVRQITSPLNRLATAAGKIRNFDLDNIDMVKSRFKELDTFSHSFEDMRVGLKSFQKYVPSELVKELLDTGEEAALGGQRRPLTVFFSDIVGFTSISENMSPEDLTAHLSEYLNEVSSILNQHQATVDKFIGDAVMAFWNAPRQIEDHAIKACKGALAVQKRIDDLHEQWQAAGKPTFRTRMGLHTDEVIVGNIGAESRMNYTVIGDGVNLASRLEGLGKFYGVNIIISEATKQIIGEQFVTRLLDKVRVVGRHEGVPIFELVGLASETSESVVKSTELFNQAIEAYFAQAWQEAEQLLENYIEKFGRDKPCQILLNRITAFETHPPQQDWDGVYIHQQK